MSEVRLIDANALKERVNRTIDYAVDEFDKGYNIGIQKAVELIDNAPTVETEIMEKQAILFLINNGWLVNHDKELRERWDRPQGEWEVDGCLIACNKCGRILLKASELYNFCPNCGADMRKENDNGKP